LNGRKISRRRSRKGPNSRAALLLEKQARKARAGMVAYRRAAIELRVRFWSFRVSIASGTLAGGAPAEAPRQDPEHSRAQKKAEQGEPRRGWQVGREEAKVMKYCRQVWMFQAEEAAARSHGRGRRLRDSGNSSRPPL